MFVVGLYRGRLVCPLVIPELIIDPRLTLVILRGADRVLLLLRRVVVVLRVNLSSETIFFSQLMLGCSMLVLQSEFRANNN